MGMVERVRRWLRGTEPTLIDYEAYQQQPGAVQRGEASGYPVVGRVGPEGMDVGGGSQGEGGGYKIQQSYDSLLQTVQDLRAALDSQALRQDQLFDRLSTLPHAAEALPQASKMQADMLKMINDRLAMHADQQRKVTEVVANMPGGGGGEEGICWGVAEAAGGDRKGKRNRPA
ncbi:MAG: hypothetical protein FWD61_20260, partial [Phycisphaerales bacterium]|nr:hypothetical protein [Phycisphaerales bacterium]